MAKNNLHGWLIFIVNVGKHNEIPWILLGMKHLAKLGALHCLDEHHGPWRPSCRVLGYTHPSFRTDWLACDNREVFRFFHQTLAGTFAFIVFFVSMTVRHQETSLRLFGHSLKSHGLHCVWRPRFTGSYFHAFDMCISIYSVDDFRC